MTRGRHPVLPARPLPGAIAVFFAGIAVAGASIEVEVAEHPIEGLFAARIEVGGQKIWASIDSAQPWLWVLVSPDGKLPGYKVGKEEIQREDMSSFEYSDGLKVCHSCQVEGALLSKNVKLGTTTAQNGPFLLAMNASVNGEAMRRTAGKTVATLGLTLKRELSYYERYKEQRETVFDMFEEEREKEEGIVHKKLTSFFKQFWVEHPEVPQTFFLSLGGDKPRMVIGADLQHGPEASGLTYMSDIFTPASAQWYTSLRAMGFSMAPQQGSDTGELVWHLDFNEFVHEGAPARLDSGAKAIHVGHGIFERVLLNLPNARCRVNEERSIDCPCNPSAIHATFPWISLSFETFDNVRFLGLDVGNDHRVCIPPSSYVSQIDESTCRLAIMDGGLYQRFFGFEGIVLGVPFFKTVPVAMDLGRNRVAFGAPYYSPSAPVSAWGVHAMQASDPVGDMATSSGKGACPCADPKNWWNVGHRFSGARVTVVLIGTVVVLVHIFLFYSPTTEGVRMQIASITGLGGTTDEQSQANPVANRPPDRGPAPDRPFVEMTGGPYGGPE